LIHKKSGYDFPDFGVGDPYRLSVDKENGFYEEIVNAFEQPPLAHHAGGPCDDDFHGCMGLFRLVIGLHGKK